GGGGRIAIHYGSSTFAGTLSLAGGGGSYPGAVGTIYETNSSGGLVVAGGQTTVDSTSNFSSVTLQSGGILNLTGAPTIGTSIAIPSGTSVVLSSSNALNNDTPATT